MVTKKLKESETLKKKKAAYAKKPSTAKLKEKKDSYNTKKENTKKAKIKEQEAKDAAPAKSTAFYRKTDKKRVASGKASVVRMEKEAAERVKKGEPTTKQQRGEYLRIKEAVEWRKAKNAKQQKKDDAAKAKKVDARKAKEAARRAKIAKLKKPLPRKKATRKTK